MKQKLLIILFSLVSTFVLGQKMDLASIDTTLFENYPDVKNYNNVSFNKDVDYFEIVIHRDSDSTIYKWGEIDEKQLDSFNSSKSLVKDGIGTWCPPSWCYYYYIFMNKKGEIEIANSNKLLEKLVPQINTKQDAIFYLRHKNLSGSIGYPVPTYQPKGKIAEINGNYYVIINRRISDCPITYADILFEISNNKVNKLDEKVTKKSNICY